MKIDNPIVIKGGAYNDIKKALRQWINLNSKDLREGLTFQLFKNGSSNPILALVRSQALEREERMRFPALLNSHSFARLVSKGVRVE